MDAKDSDKEFENPVMDRLGSGGPLRISLWLSGGGLRLHTLGKLDVQDGDLVEADLQCSLEPYHYPCTEIYFVTSQLPNHQSHIFPMLYCSPHPNTKSPQLRRDE